MKKSILIFSVLLYGCGSLAENPEITEKRNTERHKLFTECMELSAKITRLLDDYVADVVAECRKTSWSMSNWMVK